MTGSRQIERTAAAWLARRDSDVWSQRDQAKLETWLASSVMHRVAFLRLEAAWQQSDRLKALGAGVPRRLLPPRGQWGLSPSFDQPDQNSHGRDQRGFNRRVIDAHQVKLEPGALSPSDRMMRRRSRPRWGLTAAAAVFVMGIFGVLRQQSPLSPPVVYRTVLGGQESVRLADGSEAQLSSDTRLLVSQSGHERDIDLEYGEAFFAVAHDRARPFVVSAGSQRAVAVGTRFAVRRDPASVRVVVTEGLVRLQPADDSGGAATLLPAGSVALISGNEVLVRHMPVEQALQYLSWRDGYLAFHDTPLAVAVAEFNRYNSRKIVIDDAAIASLRVGGNFRWSNAQAFVRLLERAFPVRADQHADRIDLRARN